MAKTQKSVTTPQVNAEQWETLLESLNAFITASSGLAENIKNVVDVAQTKPSTSNSSSGGECPPTCKDAPHKPTCKDAPQKPKPNPCGSTTTMATQKSSEGDDKGTQKSEDDTEKEPPDEAAETSGEGAETSGEVTSDAESVKSAKSAKSTKSAKSAKSIPACPSTEKATTCTKGCGTKKETSQTSIKKSCVPTCQGPGDVATKKSETDITLKECKKACPSKSILKSKDKKKHKKDEAESHKQQIMFLGGLKTNLKNMQCTMADVEEKIRLMERLVHDYDTKNKPCGELNPAALYKEIMKPQSVPYLKAQREQRVNLGGNSSKGACNQQTCHETSLSSIDKAGPIKMLRAVALPE